MSLIMPVYHFCVRLMTSNQCVIRVGSLDRVSEDCPTPLLKLAGRPFLEYLLRNVRRFGYDDFVLLTGPQGKMVEAFASSALQSDLDCRIRVIAVPGPIGTGGALRFAAEVLQNHFLMLDGDNYFDFNLLDLAMRPVQPRVIATIALRQVPDASGYETVEMDGDRIVVFGKQPESAGPGLVNGGVYSLSRTILEYLSDSYCSLEYDVFPHLVKIQAIAGFAYKGLFLDLATPEDFAQAQKKVPDTFHRPAIFFDRDGVLNQDTGYTHKIEDFRWIDGAPQAIRVLNDLGWYVFVITNQSGVARGFYKEEDVLLLHKWMNEDLRRNGAHIDDFRYCPHHINGTVGEYAKACDCRKPEPGMILALLDQWPVDRRHSIIIGDKESDLAAAAAAGIKGVIFSGGDLVQLILDTIEK